MAETAVPINARYISHVIVVSHVYQIITCEVEYGLLIKFRFFEKKYRKNKEL